MSLIQKWNTLKSYDDNWYPSVHTWPHADILLQLKLSENDMKPLTITMIHVEAHQDDSTEFEELSIDAKLNVLCDNLATQELKALEKTNKKQRIKLLPACKCYLEHDGEILNANEASALRDNIPGQDIKEYYKKKNKWSEETNRNVNWTSYENARRRNVTKQRYVTKLCCNWLPTQNRMNMTEGTSDKCTCGEIETNDHLFECQSKKEWRKELYKQLHKHLKATNTASTITSTLLQGLRSHYEQDGQEINIQDHRQNDIGWNNIMRGWIVKTWQVEQEKHIREKHKNDASKHEKSKQWSTYLIEFFWQQGHKLWKKRCDILHETTGRAETAQKRKIINVKVTALYDMAQNVGYRDRNNIFAKTLQDKLMESVPNLTNWVASTGPAVKQVAQDHRRHMLQNTRDIRKYFYPQQHQDSENSTNILRIPNRKQTRTNSMTDVNSNSNAPT